MQANLHSLLNHIVMYALFLLATQGKGQTRSITYRWLNLPCAENINCATGCSACNEPMEDDMIVFGTNAALIGVEACPHLVATGDNALSLSGWSTTPDEAHRILLSGIAQVPVRIDSVIIVHRSELEGPTRLSVSVKDMGDGEGLDADLPTDAIFTTTVLTNCGDVEKPVGSAFSTFQLQLQAYLGNGGDWILDEVRIVVTALEDELTTGLAEIKPAGSGPASATATDLLGRIADLNSTGMRFRNGRTIIIP